MPVPSGHARHVAYGRPPATVGLRVMRSGFTVGFRVMGLGLKVESLGVIGLRV